MSGAGVMPANFYVRLTGDAPRGIHDEVFTPRFDGYRCSGIIQRNEREKRFRFVRVNQGCVEIFDLGRVYKATDTDLRSSLRGNGWNNYICGYEGKSGPLEVPRPENKAISHVKYIRQIV